jgi:hypothetical protein
LWLRRSLEATWFVLVSGLLPLWTKTGLDGHANCSVETQKKNALPCPATAPKGFKMSSEACEAWPCPVVAVIVAPVSLVTVSRHVTLNVTMPTVSTKSMQCRHEGEPTFKSWEVLSQPGSRLTHSDCKQKGQAVVEIRCHHSSDHVSGNHLGSRSSTSK